MNILILGSGGREHTLAWKVAQSPQCDRLYTAPGNGGTSNVAQNISLSLNDFDGIGDFCEQNKIDLLLVGPEAPLVDGLRDYFESRENLSKIKFIGPGKSGAMLEGSKDFSKNFMNTYGIPTAKYKTFTVKSLEQGKEYIMQMSVPVVLKADGLAAGKGVLICNSLEEALSSFEEMLVNKMFGEASTKVLVEQCLEGIELSVFLLTDGINYKILPEAKDYKRIGEGDTGPNTGGMGAVSPVSFADEEFIRKVEDRVIKPTLSGLRSEGINYVGFIFLGLMNINGNPYVIEYNVRMGDPEAQAVIPRLNTDLVDLLVAAADGKLDSIEMEIDPKSTSTVVMVAGGYPGSYPKGAEIHGLDGNHSAMVFHAGTKMAGDKTLTSGGRVLGITGMGENLEEALKKTYETVENFQWDGVNFRNDIGQDLLNY